MKTLFNERGELIIPTMEKFHLPAEKISRKDGDIAVTEAYCPNGHSLISDVRIGHQKSLHFVYASADGQKETDIVVTSVVKKCRKKVLKGQPFKKGERVKVLCPTCRTELPVLFDCECGAPIYLFYIDMRLDGRFGQSFCSRIGCVRSSHLRFSQDMIREFINNYSF